MSRVGYGSSWRPAAHWSFLLHPVVGWIRLAIGLAQRVDAFTDLEVRRGQVGREGNDRGEEHRHQDGVRPDSADRERKKDRADNRHQPVETPATPATGNIAVACLK